ncbi:hypothetical protein K505DRAFT_398706 [Melanomma pulvis-pyrius CBS 109.77]|uniref:Uncharacterized protein n=1 Tax=Melanomma pulvis-pyrius CBS 109.77 TaxID=1314802 RepID=A0A6A6WRM2_9PLEO|nr:hypothetical protein K505DRAFT_398706 [Melanomma pulvis-pyrius CBS 109.77]
MRQQPPPAATRCLARAASSNRLPAALQTVVHTVRQASSSARPARSVTRLRTQPPAARQSAATPTHPRCFTAVAAREDALCTRRSRGSPPRRVCCVVVVVVVSTCKQTPGRSPSHRPPSWTRASRGLATLSPWARPNRIVHRHVPDCARTPPFYALVPVPAFR